MFNRFFFKIKFVIYLLVLIVVSLIAFGIYAKVRGVQSIQFMEEQASSTTQIIDVMKDMASSLNEIQIQMGDLTKETCLVKAGSNRRLIEECEGN